MELAAHNANRCLPSLNCDPESGKEDCRRYKARDTINQVAGVRGVQPLNPGLARILSKHSNSEKSEMAAEPNEATFIEKRRMAEARETWETWEEDANASLHAWCFGRGYTRRKTSQRVVTQHGPKRRVSGIIGRRATTELTRVQCA
jgi:hypothetical protein